MYVLGAFEAERLPEGFRTWVETTGGRLVIDKWYVDHNYGTRIVQAKWSKRNWVRRVRMVSNGDTSYQLFDAKSPKTVWLMWDGDASSFARIVEPETIGQAV